MKAAKNGIHFTQAYAACPVSSPTRASIMTGKYPARLHLTNFIAGNRTDPESPVLPVKWKPYLEAREITMAELLKNFSNQLGRPSGAIRIGNYKLVENYENGTTELYDLHDDISESTDLSQIMKQKTKELHKLLIEWRERVNAAMPIPNPEYKPLR